jgi:hypothetical protein
VPPEGIVRKLAFATPGPHTSVPVRQHPLATLRLDGHSCRALSGANLFGSVPLSISRLTALTKLYVPRSAFPRGVMRSRCIVRGAIVRYAPSSRCRSLHDNDLNGTFPAEITTLTGLRSLCSPCPCLRAAPAPTIILRRHAVAQAPRLQPLQRQRALDSLRADRSRISVRSHRALLAVKVMRDRP